VGSVNHSWPRAWLLALRHKGSAPGPTDRSNTLLGGQEVTELRAEPSGQIVAQRLSCPIQRA